MGGFWFAMLGIGAGLALFGRPRRLPRRTGSPRSIVRIVIPARNECRSLPNLLSDLGAAGGDWDVVVVDDGSTDDTAALARARWAWRDSSTRHHHPPDGGESRGRAKSGARTATGPEPDVLVFLDADVRVGPGAIESLLLEREDTRWSRFGPTIPSGTVARRAVERPVQRRVDDGDRGRH